MRLSVAKSAKRILYIGLKTFHNVPKNIAAICRTDVDGRRLRILSPMAVNKVCHSDAQCGVKNTPSSFAVVVNGTTSHGDEACDHNGVVPDRTNLVGN
jgi:hypothetical protein